MSKIHNIKDLLPPPGDVVQCSVNGDDWVSASFHDIIHADGKDICRFLLDSSDKFDFTYPVFWRRDEYELEEYKKYKSDINTWIFEFEFEGTPIKIYELYNGPDKTTYKIMIHFPEGKYSQEIDIGIVLRVRERLALNLMAEMCKRHYERNKNKKTP